ncbi:MAG TPA: histone deacetylase [bacterium]|nr:histone deacetylase [bacterium]
MRFVYSDRYKLDIGAHVFQMEKYAMVRDNLLTAGQAEPTDFIEPPEPNLDDIRLVHTPEYVDDLLNLRWSQRTVHSELPLNSEVVQGFMLFASGTVTACRFALEDKIAMHLGGGFHHAYADHGEGFCYINDIAVGIRKMQQEKRIERAAVIDCDLHQGNGTAKIFQGDTKVFTFSIHQERLYPVKERSDYDIGLDEETGDELYNEQLQGVVGKILAQHKPELVVYVAGADPFKFDQLGALRLTKRGLAFRDRIVIDGCYKRGIPVVPVTAGGYAHDPTDTAEIHTNTARECLRVLGQLKPAVKPPESGEQPAPSQPEQQPS